MMKPNISPMFLGSKLVPSKSPSRRDTSLRLGTYVPECLDVTLRHFGWGGYHVRSCGLRHGGSFGLSQAAVPGRKDVLVVLEWHSCGGGQVADHEVAPEGDGRGPGLRMRAGVPQ